MVKYLVGDAAGFVVVVCRLENSFSHSLGVKVTHTNFHEFHPLLFDRMSSASCFEHCVLTNFEVVFLHHVHVVNNIPKVLSSLQLLLTIFLTKRDVSCVGWAG